MTFFLLGYYGFGNAGDEVLHDKARDVLTRRFPMADIDSSRGSFLSKCFNVIRCDSLVIGGGNLLQNSSSQSSLLYYLFLIFFALCLRKPCYAIGIGVGPVNGWFSKCVVSFVLSRFKGLSFRDEESMSLFGQTNARLSSDLFFYHCQSVLTEKRALSGSPHIGFSINPRGIDSSRFTDMISESSYESSFILAHATQDGDFLKPELSDYPQTYLSDLFTGSVKPNIDVLISNRYHACLWAASQGIPFISIGEDPKLCSLKSEFDQAHSESLGRDIWPLVEDVLDHYLSYQSELAKGVQIQLERSDEHERVFI